MASYLVIEGNPTTRQKKAQEILEGHFVHEIKDEKGKIGIDPIKALRKLISVKPPGGKRRGVLILEAQRMNEQAQNAILKNLEEPPASVTFVLTAPNPKLLLPTVVSRCALIKVEAKAGEDDLSRAKEFLALSSAKRLKFFESQVGYEFDSALEFFEELEKAWEKDLQNPVSTKVLKKTWATKKILRDPHANIKITVDEYLLSW